MPELPEVETVRAGLARLLPCRVVKDVWHDWPKGFPNAPADVARFLVGAKIGHVRRRDKVLIIELSTDYSLVIHLKMTGQLVFVAAGNKKNKEERIKKKEESDSNSLFVIPSSSEAGRFAGGHPNDSLIGKL